ncbi:hypothetical protein D884_00538 [Pseudomonas sp. URMO17WK12:I10]|nr:hypothetical protein F633_00052 [Pseudomonas sp. LAMO17WK12:I3]RED14975.1 hypothetical protein D884_00538 [Pseudomonas sp. URMO17WK12:I10]SOD07076.1 hypothetical protein SAMN05660967_00996 [Pseudomonas sp. URMO17WK12:I9]
MDHHECLYIWGTVLRLVNLLRTTLNPLYYVASSYAYLLQALSDFARHNA